MDANPMPDLQTAIAHADEIATGCGPCADEHRQLATWLRELEALRRQPPAVAVPKGWKLVPEDATPKMVDEGRQYLPCTPGGVTNATAADVYAAMLAAALSTVATGDALPTAQDEGGGQL